MMDDSKRGRDAFTVPSSNNRQRQAGGGGGFAVLDENGNLQVTSAQGGDKVQFNKGEKM